ncbi:hypothetical protein WH47_11512 [Habropoda laboriosa]|uniref:Uncharacterized protein n=1 Tax=Habropoda laboriosa TaxID=597456 RepID=A0A0L7QLB5_9HYME|nr:hypothetical protein WH47_11512 [Habropoda laboriosa]
MILRTILNQIRKFDFYNGTLIDLHSTSLLIFLDDDVYKADIMQGLTYHQYLCSEDN